MKKAVLLTSIPSPYMVELVDKVNLSGDWYISVLYERHTSKGRIWSQSALSHDHIFLEDTGPVVVDTYIKEADLAVVGTLWGKNSSVVIRCQKNRAIPLVFWGERPGALHRSVLADLVRRFLIAQRFGHASAVWGIGNWAVQEYQRCFRTVSQFANMPYASNLAPYVDIDRHRYRHIAGRPVRILYSGSLIVRKGVDLLMHAVLKLLGEGQEVQLTMMGQGNLMAQLRSMIPEKFGSKITFLGFKDWHELPSVYATHDLLVAPSRYDGWGLIVIEGLAAGMPVIATDMMGAARDFIRHGENGWIIPADNGKALYSAVKTALCAPLEDMGNAARLSVESWSLDKAAEQWCDLADCALGIMK